MSIPVRYAQFKSAGIYRIVIDKSTMPQQDASVTRLVVGYSEKGPFNIPVTVNDAQEFRSLFGDISKKLEKRGVFFHRIALQCLQKAPIICLNLKKFANENVGASTISTDFNPKFDPIETVHLKVEDIFDTTRFWELDEEKLNDADSIEGVSLDQYINISATDVKANSCTYFIRKASGSKVSSYDLTINDWYSNEEEIPEYLENKKNNLVSDFFAEIYVFKGKFTSKQVLASDTLKNYFIVTNETDDNGDYILKLRPYVLDAYGDAVDTLDALYNDETSNAIGHWIGSLIPQFKNKKGTYESLDIKFNSDQYLTNMMMSFNTDMLTETESATIDLSGRSLIPTEKQADEMSNTTLTLAKLYDGTATTTVLGNLNAPVMADVIKFKTNIYDPDSYDTESGAVKDLYIGKTKVGGTLYVKSIEQSLIRLRQVGGDDDVQINIESEGDTVDKASWKAVTIAKKLGVEFDDDMNPKEGVGTYWSSDDAFTNDEDPLAGPEKVITAISRLEYAEDLNDGTSAYHKPYTDIDDNLKASFLDATIVTSQDYTNTSIEAVYGTSISFIDYNENNWEWVEDVEIITGIKQNALVCYEKYDKSLISVLQKGDCLLAEDGTIDMNGDLIIDDEDKDGYFDNVYVSEINTKYDDNGDFEFYYILFSGKPYEYTIKDDEGSLSNLCLVRVDKALNQEIGTMTPTYLEGYTYENPKPDGIGMYAKLQWQQFILSALSEYKGVRIGLLNKSEIDYRYVIDTFESYPQSSLKAELSQLCKEKQSAFCIANFPSVQTFRKCPYTSFTDNKGVFNVDYVVAGYNKKKAAALTFGLPSDNEGASFIAFYTPLKFSDGTIESMIPSAGIVSNLFVEKYISRQPYYIVAGPNYGSINVSGLVGPDYKYSRDELNVIEPYGVNCMVYKPGFGTFINANQTAKQTPLSALSRVNVRELCIYLQDEIEKVLQQYQWEFNNETTRNAILDKANQICAIIAANGGIQAYQNIMDTSNNTDEIIDNEMAVINTHIEPGFGCGKMIQELTLYRTGQMTAAISDQ